MIGHEAFSIKSKKGHFESFCTVQTCQKRHYFSKAEKSETLKVAWSWSAKAAIMAYYLCKICTQNLLNYDIQLLGTLSNLLLHEMAILKGGSDSLHNGKNI